MSTVRTIAKNTTVLLVAQVASYLLAFFCTMYAARYLSAAGYGILSFAFAFTGIFSVLTDFGLSPLTVREVARDKSLASKYLANVSLMKIVLVAITFGLIALTISLMGYPDETIKVVYLLALSSIFGAFTGMFYSIFQAFERMEFQAIGQTLNAALLLGGVIFAMRHGFSVVGFAYVYATTGIVALAYSFAIMKLRFSDPTSTSAPKGIEFDWSFWKPATKQALPFFLAATFDSISFGIATVMLSAMKGNAVAGWYSAPYQLTQVLTFIPATFGTSIYPVLSRFHTSSQESLRFAYQRSFKYLTLLGLPIAVGTTLLANRIIMIIYQSGFAQSIIALQILIWAVPIAFPSYVFGQMMAAINKQPVALKISFIGMISAVVMNLLLIPGYSYVGASIATVVRRLIGFVLYLYFLSKLDYGISIYKSITKPVIASVTMGLFILFFANMNLPLLILVAIVIYFGVLILLKAFSKEDLDLFNQIVAGRRRK